MAGLSRGNCGRGPESGDGAPTQATARLAWRVPCVTMKSGRRRKWKPFMIPRAKSLEEFAKNHIHV